MVLVIVLFMTLCMRPSYCVVCTDDKGCMMTVFLIPNGGHETREPFSAEVEPGASVEVLWEYAGQVLNGVEGSLPVDVFDLEGSVVRDAVVDGQTYVLVPRLPQAWKEAAGRPLTEPFVWPPLRVGHRKRMANVTGAGGIPLYLETLSVTPRVFLIENFLSDEEADFLVDFAKHGLQMGRARTIAAEDHGEVNPARTNTYGWLFKSVLQTNASLAQMIRGIDVRINQVTHIWEPEVQEALQVVHYGSDKEHFWGHHDFFPPSHDSRAKKGSNRVITFFFYLNDVATGGETVFLHAGPTGFSTIRRSELHKCDRGLLVKPRKGNAVMWYNLKTPIMEGLGDETSRHGGCPPLSGEKWGANRWVWNWRAPGDGIR